MKYKKSNIRILDNFLRYLSINYYAKTTIESYSLDIKMFFEFLTIHLEWGIGLKDINVFLLKTVNRQDIEQFLVYLALDRQCGSSRRQRVIASLKHFFKWLYWKYSILSNCENPMTNILVPVRTVRLPKCISLDDAKRLQSIFTKENSKFPERNNAIMTLFLANGLRLSELTSLNIFDINFTNKSFNVVGKGNKERTCYLSDFVIKKINIYLQTRDDDCEALFVNQFNKRLSNSAVQSICEKAYNLTGLSDYNYSVHTLRHTAATYVYRQTKDILVTKEFLGHEHIVSTQIYIHADNENIRNAVNSNPLANLRAKA